MRPAAYSEGTMNQRDEHRIAETHFATKGLGTGVCFRTGE
jgi:hypothetical protein